MEGQGDLASKVTSRVILGVTPFRVLITLLTKSPAPPSRIFLFLKPNLHSIV